MDVTANVQQRKNKEKPKEKGVTEKPKRFVTQEMERRFSLFEEVLFILVTCRMLHEGCSSHCRMQSKATLSSMTRKKELLPRHHWIFFSKRVDRV